LATTIIMPSSRVSVSRSTAGERVEVDRLVGFRERQRAARNHQTGADQRHPRAIVSSAEVSNQTKRQIAELVVQECKLIRQRLVLRS
jgi:hypothetical protein